MIGKMMSLVENDYSQAVKGAFILITPILIFNSILIALMINVQIIQNTYFKIITLIIYASLSIIVLVNVSSNYAKSRSISIPYVLANGLLMYLLIMMRLNTSTDYQTIPILVKMSTIGLIYSAIIPLCIVNLYAVISNLLSNLKWTSMPPAVSNIFKEVILTLVVLLIIVTITGTTTQTIWITLLSILVLIQKLIAGRILILPIIIVLATTLIWFNGLHAMAVLNFFLRPFWTIAIIVNGLIALSNGIINIESLIFTEPFFQWFVWIGGTGGTLGLLIAIRLFAKSDSLKELYNISKVSSIFNINETLIYGIPIVKNKLFAIPFILGPVLITIVSYYSISNGWINEPYLLMPWVLPAPIGAFLSTGDIRAVVLVLFNIAVLTLLYMPSVIIYERKQTRS